jgi:putative transposase
MKTLVVNIVIQRENGQFERVLWVDPTGNEIVLIDIQERTALPVFYPRATIEATLERNTLQVVDQAPVLRLFPPEEDIPEQHRQRRDETWAVIQPLVEMVPDIFMPQQRGPLVTAAVAQSGRTKKTIYGYLRRYWQGGQTRNALLPHFDRCGGRGQNKAHTEHKRGRPSALELARQTRIGVNVDDHIRECFRKGIRMFYNTRQARSLKEAYQLTLEKFFHRGYEWRDGVPVPVLPPAEELPTYWQFEYWHKKERNLSSSLIARRGERRFNSEHRELLGDSTQMAFGPGSVYQIDATVGDIYLVSALDPQRIIGKPTIYLVVDVFSRLITGLGVSLENPSWLGAMLSLENATTDKVAFCAQYDIAITPEEWPSCYLPEMLLADRGELEGYSADNLVNALNIHVANTAPYRADMKGIVEQYFRLNNLRVIASLPGAVDHDHGRGDADYRLDACLTLHEFTYLMMQGVLRHNRSHRMAHYPLDRAMIVDQVEPYPIDLWQWGVQNRSGHLRTLPPEIVRLNLLPQGQASITHRGIRFQGLLYSCDLAQQENWFVQAREQGRRKIMIAYDPRLTDVIYLRLEQGHRMEPCYLLDTQGMPVFRGQDWATTHDYFSRQQERHQAAVSRDQQARAELNAHKQQIVRQAQERQQAAPEVESKRARLGGIRQNRDAERTQERQTGAWELAPKQPSNEAEGATDTGYVPPPHYLDELQEGEPQS